MIRSRSHCRPTGAVLLIVLICLAVAAALVVNWARVGVLQARQARTAEDRLQAVWLAESALERAAERLNADPDYQGETWQIAPVELDAASTATSDSGGVAVIKVEPIVDRPRARLVSVQADFPVSGSHSNRVTKHVEIDVPTRKETP